MVAGFAVAALTVPVMAVQPVSALNGCTGKACITDGAGKVDTGSKKTVPQIIKQVTEILLFILGAVAVIMIVVGGFKFVTSGGSPEQVKSAKNTIMYSVVGIIVAIVAWGIVDFVVKQL
jgi:hypothetical protein